MGQPGQAVGGDRGPRRLSPLSPLFCSVPIRVHQRAERSEGRGSAPAGGSCARREGLRQIDGAPDGALWRFGRPAGGAAPGRDGGPDAPNTHRGSPRVSGGPDLRAMRGLVELRQGHGPEWHQRCAWRALRPARDGRRCVCVHHDIEPRACSTVTLSLQDVTPLLRGSQRASLAAPPDLRALQTVEGAAPAPVAPE